MKTPRFPWLAVVLILAAPSLAQAQFSVHTPDAVVGAANSKMKVKFKVDVSGPQVSADPIPLTVSEAGTAVRDRVMNAINTAATAAPLSYVCSPSLGDACGGAGGDDDQTWIYTAPAGSNNCGFGLVKLSPDFERFGVSAGPPAGCAPKAGLIWTNAGNTANVDLLPQYLVKVNPTGDDALVHHGPVIFQVFHTQGGTNPRTFTIANTASFGTLTALQDAIRDGFNGMGLSGFTAVTDNTPGKSHFPSDFAGFSVSGTEMPAVPVVRIINVPGTVTEIGVKAVAGAIAIQETSIQVTGASLPGVSPWGMALLFGMLLLTGYWILRRRQRLSVTR